MSTKVQFRRGNTTQMAAFTGAQGEVVVNTDTNVLVVHDGVTAGGFATPQISYVQSSYNKANGAVQTAFVTHVANGTSIIPSTNNATISFTAAQANGIVIAGNATANTIDFGLQNSGVFAATYGNNISIPIVTVDNFGRVTSVANTPVSVATLPTALHALNVDLDGNLNYDVITATSGQNAANIRNYAVNFTGGIGSLLSYASSNGQLQLVLTS